MSFSCLYFLLQSVCRFMYPFHRPSAGVVHVLEGGIPSESFGGGAGDARYARHAAGGTFTGKMLFEDGTVEVFFFVLRRVDREAPGGIRHFSVADGLGGHLFSACRSSCSRRRRRIVPSAARLFPRGARRRKPRGEFSSRSRYRDTFWLPGFRRMAISRNSLSRKGTRPSTPQAHKLLLARRQSYI